VRLDERARVFVSGGRGQQSLLRERTTRIGIGDEDGPVGRVEEDGVDGLGAEAGHAQQLPAQPAERRPAQPVKASLEARQQPFGERVQPPGLQTVGPGRADHLGQLGLRHGGQSRRRQQAARAQRDDRAGGVRPGGVLREDRARSDLEGGAPGPPVLRPMAAQQVAVQVQQPRLDGIVRWSGNRPAHAQHEWS